MSLTVRKYVLSLCYCLGKAVTRQLALSHTALSPCPHKVHRELQRSGRLSFVAGDASDSLPLDLD